MRVVQNEPAKVPFHEAFYFNAIEILGRPRVSAASFGAFLSFIISNLRGGEMFVMSWDKWIFS